MFERATTPPWLFLATRIAAACIVWSAGRCLAAETPISPVASPLSPEESLAHIQVPSGLRLELVACEPAVIDPVEARFDERGRLWVVEMSDYPNGPPQGQPGSCRIKILTDRDGDGRFETAQVFADQLLFATGLQPWRGGAIVTLAGQVAYLPDADGNGQADGRETWFTGLAEENPQLRANHPRLALDHRVYVANGLRGGQALDTRLPGAAALPIQGRNFCFDPRGGGLQAISGHGQFGLTFDAAGNRFECSNRNPLIHVVLPDHYLARNPFLAVPAVVNDVAAAGDASKVYPLAQTWTTSILHAGQFTAACGVFVHSGAGLPEPYAEAAFICEPTGNLVHCESLTAAGASFTSKSPVEGREFLASTDTWFRPVNLESGPDGALYVVDMYRAVIEHPQWVPDELKNRPDERFGDDRGRIYRVSDAAPVQESPFLPATSSTSTNELVDRLEDPIAWRRQTAARLLYERQDASAHGALTRLLRTSGQPAARLYALWALEGLNRLNEDDLAQALKDSTPSVREHAIALSERHAESWPHLLAQAIELADDPSPRVRFQAALSAGQSDDPANINALSRAGLAGADDPWTRRAVASARPEVAAPLLARLLEASVQTSNDAAADASGRLALCVELAQVVGARRSPTEMADVLRALTERASQAEYQRESWAILSALAASGASRGAPLNVQLDQWRQEAPDLASRIDQMFAAASAAADTDSTAEPARLDAIALLRYGPYGVAGPTLLRLLNASTSDELRAAAATALIGHRHVEIGAALASVLPGQTPRPRQAMLATLLAQENGPLLAIEAIESHDLQPSELDPSQTKRLLEYPDAALRARAAAILDVAPPPDRQQALARYLPALKLEAEPARGLPIFQKNCATCHRIGTVGVDVAPSIADARTKTHEQLLLDIIQPNKAIDNHYLSYSVVTQRGETLVGLLAAETASSLTIKQPEGKIVLVLRQDVDEIRSNGVSLMPEGLERNIPLQEMADLISFVKNWRYLEQNLPIRAESQP